MNRDKFQNIALLRLEEAEKLLEHKFYSGAYYLAGYCIECALKACIAKQTRQYDFPPERNIIEKIYTHKIIDLINSSGLKTELETECKINAEFESNWKTVKDWKENSRYNVANEGDARDLIEAISNNENGVLKWIKQHW